MHFGVWTLFQWKNMEGFVQFCMMTNLSFILYTECSNAWNLFWSKEVNIELMFKRESFLADSVSFSIRLTVLAWNQSLPRFYVLEVYLHIRFSFYFCHWCNNACQVNIGLLNWPSELHPQMSLGQYCLFKWTPACLNYHLRLANTLLALIMQKHLWSNN